jgi:hypothetical protein
LNYLEGRDHLGNVGIDEIVITWIKEKEAIVLVCTGFIWLKIGWNLVNTIINL